MGFENMDLERMAETAGGRLQATTLIQKRIRELQRGWPSLVAGDAGDDLSQTALTEFLEGKIELISGEQAEELRERRVQEDMERSRQREAARRAAELEAGPSPLGSIPGLGGTLGRR